MVNTIAKNPEALQPNPESPAQSPAQKLADLKEKYEAAPEKKKEKMIRDAVNFLVDRGIRVTNLSPDKLFHQKIQNEHLKPINDRMIEKWDRNAVVDDLKSQLDGGFADPGKIEKVSGMKMKINSEGLETKLKFKNHRARRRARRRIKKLNSENIEKSALFILSAHPKWAGGRMEQAMARPVEGAVHSVSKRFGDKTGLFQNPDGLMKRFSQQYNAVFKPILNKLGSGDAEEKKLAQQLHQKFQHIATQFSYKRFFDSLKTLKSQKDHNFAPPTGANS